MYMYSSSYSISYILYIIHTWFTQEYIKKGHYARRMLIIKETAQLLQILITEFINTTKIHAYMYRCVSHNALLEISNKLIYHTIFVIPNYMYPPSQNFHFSLLSSYLYLASLAPNTKWTNISVASNWSEVNKWTTAIFICIMHSEKKREVRVKKSTCKIRKSTKYT